MGDACDTCESAWWGALNESCTQSDGSPGSTVYLEYVDHWYNCFTGSNCTFDHTENTQECNSQVFCAYCGP